MASLESPPRSPDLSERGKVSDRASNVFRKFANSSAASPERPKTDETKMFKTIFGVGFFIFTFTFPATFSIFTFLPFSPFGIATWFTLLWRLIWRVVVPGALLWRLRRVSVLVFVCTMRRFSTTDVSSNPTWTESYSSNKSFCSKFRNGF